MQKEKFFIKIFEIRENREIKINERNFMLVNEKLVKLFFGVIFCFCGISVLYFYSRRITDWLFVFFEVINNKILFSKNYNLAFDESDEDFFPRNRRSFAWSSCLLIFQNRCNFFNLVSETYLGEKQAAIC